MEVCVHKYSACGSQKRVSETLKLELHKVVCCLWELRTDFRYCPGKVMCSWTLHHLSSHGSYISFTHSVQNSMRCHLSWRTLQPYASVCISKPGKGIKEFWSFSLCFYFIITRCHASVVDHTAYFLILHYCLDVLWVSLEQCACWVHSTSEK